MGIFVIIHISALFFFVSSLTQYRVRFLNLTLILFTEQHTAVKKRHYCPKNCGKIFNYFPSSIFYLEHKCEISKNNSFNITLGIFNHFKIN